MPSLVLRDSEQHDAGFLLLAGSNPFTQIGPRDVVLMSLPLPNESALARFLRAHRNSEFAASVASELGGYAIRFAVEQNVQVSATLAANGIGTWSVTGVGQGTCEALP
jgi:hypothetical protein